MTILENMIGLILLGNEIFRLKVTIP